MRTEEKDRDINRDAEILGAISQSHSQEDNITSPTLTSDGNDQDNYRADIHRVISELNAKRSISHTIINDPKKLGVFSIRLINSISNSFLGVPHHMHGKRP